MQARPGAGERFGPYLVLAVFFAASAFLRPLIPTAETRYLTVTWEMFQRRDFLLLTLNFEPYYHKPPLLFWLIDAGWAIFGVHRVVALGVVYVIAAVTLHLTVRLAKTMFPDSRALAERAPWLTLGGAVFLIYASLIYMDILQAAFVLAFMISAIEFARGGGMKQAVLAGAWIGLGILAKGPVMFVHILWPVLLYPLWRGPGRDLGPAAFYRGFGIMILASIAVVALWLGPVLVLADENFLYNLIWRQSAERISGSLDGAHPRAFWYYLQFLPILLLPWICSPGLYRSSPLASLRQARETRPDDYRMIRLLAFWFAGVFVTFSLISGKQPHYLVPEALLLSVLFACFMTRVSLPLIRNVAIGMVGLFIVGQAVSAFTVFDRLDLKPLAAYVHDRPQAPWAYAGAYEGEVNFLARRTAPVAEIGEDEADAWLAAHPDGYVIAKTKEPVSSFPHAVFDQPADSGRYVVTAGPETQEGKARR